MSTLRLLCLVAIVLSISACSVLNPPSEPNTYVLDARVDAPPNIRRSQQVLLVALPRAEPGFDSLRIAYTRTPLALNYYSKSQWADTPARMLTPLLVRALEQSGRFRAVITQPTPALADLHLETQLIRLQQEFLQQPSQVRLTLRAQLLDNDQRRVIASQLFEAVAPAPSEDAYGGVQAANQAVAELLKQILAFVLKVRA